MSTKLQRKISQYVKRFPQVSQLKITNSSAVNKRFKATFLLDGKKKTVNFGLDTATTYFDDSRLKEKRRLYQARASKITNKYGEYTYNLPGTANSLAYYILW